MNYPEISENDTRRGGDVIGVSVEASAKAGKLLNTSFEEMIAFNVTHGAGHNAGLGHEGALGAEWSKSLPDYLPSVPVYKSTIVPSNSVMADAQHIYDYVNIPHAIRIQNPQTKYVIGDFISSSANQGMIRQYYQRRFGNNLAIPSAGIKTQ